MEIVQDYQEKQEQHKRKMCPNLSWKYLSTLLGSGTETIKDDETLELLIIKSSIRQILLSLEELYRSALSNHMIV